VGRIVRLLPDGQIDPTFNTGSGFAGAVNDLRMQPDGKVLVGGSFTQFNGTAAFRLIRLNSDGSRDTGFSATAPGDVRRIALRADGRILIAYSGLVDRIACLLPTGAQDPGFNNSINIGTTVNEIIELGNGGIFLVGNFSVPGTPALTGYRLLTNSGQPDGSFAPGTGLGNPNSGLPAAGLCAAVQADGRILVGGQFTTCNEVGRNRIARLFGNNSAPSLLVRPKVLLGGPYDTGSGLMNDQVRAALLVPFVEPYTALGYTLVGSGGQLLTSPVLAVTGNNAIVDWVLLELRGVSSPFPVIASRSALLQRDGDVVEVDGVSPVGVSAPAGDYRVAIRHRNHLGVMTASAVALSGTATIVDLTSPATATFGTNARKTVGSTLVLWPGDATGNGQLRYTGSANDRDPILIAVGSTTPNATVPNVYDRRDTNLDGVIKYTGAANDRDIILTNVGSTTPNTTRTQQLP